MSGPKLNKQPLRTFGGQEHVGEHLERPGILLAARSAEGIHGRADGDIVESGAFE